MSNMRSISGQLAAYKVDLDGKKSEVRNVYLERYWNCGILLLVCSIAITIMGMFALITRFSKHSEPGMFVTAVVAAIPSLFLAIWSMRVGILGRKVLNKIDHSSRNLSYMLTFSMYLSLLALMGVFLTLILVVLEMINCWNVYTCRGYDSMGRIMSVCAVVACTFTHVIIILMVLFARRFKIYLDMMVGKDDKIHLVGEYTREACCGSTM